jgi:hypothetical protein
LETNWWFLGRRKIARASGDSRFSRVVGNGSPLTNVASIVYLCTQATVYGSSALTTELLQRALPERTSEKYLARANALAKRRTEHLLMKRGVDPVEEINDSLLRKVSVLPVPATIAVCVRCDASGPW